MDHVTGEIRRALDHRLWLVALQSTMALIDMCGALSTRTGNASRAAFKAWCEKWLSDSPLTPDDLYSLRCGILHQGRTSGRSHVKVLFSVPSDAGNRADRNVFDGTLNLDLDRLCHDICRRVDDWWADAKDRDPVNTNAQHLVRVQPDALAEFIGGVPGIT